MTTQLTTFNAAQACIYTRSNLSRAFQGFDDTDITSISLRDDTCVVVRTDGSEQSYPRETIKTAYQDYTNRLKDFFAYLGPTTEDLVSGTRMPISCSKVGTTPTPSVT